MIAKKKIIYGCESRGDADSPYLTRWEIGGKLFGIYLHVFHRSDADEHHDHPWNFVSIILWRGYVEETVCKCCDGAGCKEDPIIKVMDEQTWGIPFCHDGVTLKRVRPGTILFRKATHRHRVVLIDQKPAVTLVIRGPKVREWGFFTRQGWQSFRDYFVERGCK